MIGEAEHSPALYGQLEFPAAHPYLLFSALQSRYRDFEFPDLFLARDMGQSICLGDRWSIRSLFLSLCRLVCCIVWTVGVASLFTMELHIPSVHYIIHLVGQLKSQTVSRRERSLV